MPEMAKRADKDAAATLQNLPMRLQTQTFSCGFFLWASFREFNSYNLIMSLYAVPLLGRQWFGLAPAFGQIMKETPRDLAPHNSVLLCLTIQAGS